MAEPGEKFITFEGRTIEKSTMCANCMHFCGDATQNLEDWAPMRDADVEKVKTAIFFTGLDLPGMERGDVGLQMARLMGQGKSPEEAMQTIEAGFVKEARLRVGDEIWRADKRYANILFVQKALESGLMGRCHGSGVKPNGDPVDFLIFSGYHCHKWDARTGASVAHDGRPLDPLPDELVARADEHAKPVTK